MQRIFFHYLKGIYLASGRPLSTSGSSKRCIHAYGSFAHKGTCTNTTLSTMTASFLILPHNDIAFIALVSLKLLQECVEQCRRSPGKATQWTTMANEGAAVLCNRCA